MPENSIQGFLKAIDLGVDAIELDIVVTKDKQLLVAHDPWFEAKIGDVPAGVNNFFQLSLEEIQQQHFGTNEVLDFPEQQKINVVRPTLSEVVQACINYKPTLPQEFFVIEVKSQENWYNTYQLEVDEYAALLDESITRLGVGNFCMVQSFDHNFLNAFYKIRQDIPLGILVEDTFPLSGHLALLDFKPAYYNPEHILISKQLLHKLNNLNIKCYAWTVNEITRKKELINLGIDGIITDYP